MAFSGEITFSADMQKMLDKIQARIGNLQPVMERAAAMLQGNVFKHFDEERGSSGKWKPLAASTKKWKAKHGWSKPLQNTGALRQRQVPSAGKDYAQVVNSAASNKGYFYARPHEYGLGNVPKRDFMFTDKTEMDKIAEMIADYVVEVGL